jgi:hypothetical protein
MAAVEPGDQFPVIHSELHQPVKHEKKDDDKYKQPYYCPEYDPADSYHHTIEIMVSSYPALKLGKKRSGSSLQSPFSCNIFRSAGQFLRGVKEGIVLGETYRAAFLEKMKQKIIF